MHFDRCPTTFGLFKNTFKSYFLIVPCEEGITIPCSRELQGVYTVRMSPQGAIVRDSHLARRTVQRSEGVHASLHGFDLPALCTQCQVSLVTSAPFLEGAVVVLEDFELFLCQLDLGTQCPARNDEPRDRKGRDRPRLFARALQVVHYVIPLLEELGSAVEAFLVRHCVPVEARAGIRPELVPELLAGLAGPPHDVTAQARHFLGVCDIEEPAKVDGADVQEGLELPGLFLEDVARHVVLVLLG